jgi:phosphoribosylformylglycinamidine synthase
VLDQGEVVVDVPAELFTDACPTYQPPAAESREIAARRAENPTSRLPDLHPEAVIPTLLELLGSPNIGSRRPVYSQYDHTILTNTVVGPGTADAAVLRIKGSRAAIAAATDCNSRYCYLDPELGAALAVAEATRNVACVGARPLGITNCLNFGSPLKTSGMYQLQRAVAGIAAACRALDVPVVSGNVSLYNETGDHAVMPTPTIGAVGLLANARLHATARWRTGDEIAVIGSSGATLGGSEYLACTQGSAIGSPPALDLDLERRVQGLLVDAIGTGELRTAHDCAEGGLAVTLAEMAIHSECGAIIDLGERGRLDEQWFGEAASRVIVAGTTDELAVVQQRCDAAGVPFTRIGSAGGRRLSLGSHGSVALDAVRSRFDAALDQLS